MGALVAIAACAGSSGATNDQGSSGGSSAPAIRIGALVGITGFGGSGQKPAADVAQAWAKWVNSQGGIAGQPVQMYVQDTQGNPATALAAAKTLVGTDHVIAVVQGDPGTDTVTAQYLQSQNVLVIGGYAVTSVWGEATNYLGQGATSRADSVLPLLTAKALGAKKVAEVVCAEVAVCKNVQGYVQPVVGQYGLSWGGIYAVAASAASYQAQCVQMIAAGVDFMPLGLTPDVASRVMKDCISQGYKGWFGINAGTLSEDLLSNMPSGAKIAGAIDAFPTWVPDAPVQTYLKVLKTYGLGDSALYVNSTATWTALQLFAQAMTHAPKNPTRQDVFNAYWNIKGADLDGLMAQKMTYAKGQPQPQVNCGWLYSRTADGKFQILNDGGPSGNSVTAGGLRSSCITPSS